jgi:sulfatase maturation enzyme AslB (radical SAM superfamily)
MTSNQLSLILLPTDKCNVACEYCFEDKTAGFMTHEQLALTIEKLLDHMEHQRIHELIIYWQGGEVMIMQPEWFERAHELISAASITGEFFTKDPYCEVYKALFSRMESIAAELSRARFARSLPVLPRRADVLNPGNSL